MFTLLLALSPAAQASGYYAADPGVRAAGRAQAFTAGADDLTAQLYNPAALIRSQDLQALVNLSLIDQYVRFDRLDEGDPGFDAVENTRAPLPIPNVHIGGSFGLPDTSFALGFFTPQAPWFTYDPAGPQRYSLTRADVIESSFGPSVAHRFGWLTLGASLYGKFLQVRQDLAITTGSTTTSQEDPSQDVYVSLGVADPFTLSWNAGLLAEPTDWLSIGLELTPPVRYQAVGGFEADMSQNFFRTSELITDDTIVDDNVTLLLDMPMIIRSGVAVRPSDDLELELDFVYSGWSIIQQLVVTDVELVMNINQDNPLIPDGTPDQIVATDDIILPAGYRDTVALRLGGEYDLSEAVSVRAGGLYETSAVPPKTMNLQLIDGTKYGYALGATLMPWDRWAFDLAWHQTFFAPIDISNSEFAQVRVAIDLLDLSAPPDITEGKIVGNGSYSVRYYTAGLGVTHYFGRGASQ